jgi:hypothetical protein
MLELLAFLAAGGWLLAFGWSAAVTARPPRPAATSRPQAVRPALVNLAVTRCRLDAAAYPATILDLAGRGYLVITERAPGQLWCEGPGGLAGSGLAPSESLVLAGVRALAVQAGAPFEVLAGSCVSDIQGRWDPFDRAVRAEGRQAGLVRRRLPVAGQAALSRRGGGGRRARLPGGACPAAHRGLRGASAGFFAILLPAYWAARLARHDRLTGDGAALAAWAVQAAAETAASWGWPGPAVPGPAVPGPAVPGTATPGPDWPGSGMAGPGWPSPGRGWLGAWSGRGWPRLVRPGLAQPQPGGRAAGPLAGRAQPAGHRGRRRPPGAAGRRGSRPAGTRPRRRRAAARRPAPWQAEDTPRPCAAWSSLGGQWRLVPIRPLPFGRTNPVVWLFLAAWLALMVYLTSLLPGLWGTLPPIVLVAAFAAATVTGVRRIAAWLAKPRTVTFQGQVIARWVERRGSGDDDVYVPYLAVDDGERAWSFGVGGAALDQLSLGDPVTVRASPRTGKLFWLVPDRPATSPDAETAAPGPLLTSDEVAAAVGRPIRATGVQAGAASAIYRGEGITVIVTVAEGRLGMLSSGPAKRFGRRLPGPGDEAWLVSRDRTIVFRQGTVTAKVTIGGSAAATVPPDVLPRLAATVAARLPHPAAPGPPGP